MADAKPLVTPVQFEPAGALARPGRERSRVWRRFRRHPLALAGAALLLVIALAALAAPLLPLANPIPTELQTINRLRPIGSPGYLLGSDELGRDVLSRLIWGGRTSLMAGVGAALLSLVPGVLIGLAAGYFGGWVDSIATHLIDIVMAFPGVLLAIAIVAAAGPGLTNAMIAVAIVGIPLYARLVRGHVLSLREREFIQAAEALGLSTPRIVFRHVLPNCLALIIVAGTLDIGAKLIATASLSFLGLGTQPPQPDWGAMLATGRQFFFVAPHVAILPGVLIFATVVAVNLVGEGLQEALDSRLPL
ncbi:MAG: ABC transporter permease [Chloroflexota bacterium]|nr:ABC transporter permease [Dehalococcoidia bacterium]MDW8253158.1 ABC transporter permease [Chloroflexota bacterium]